MIHRGDIRPVPVLIGVAVEMAGALVAMGLFMVVYFVVLAARQVPEATMLTAFYQEPGIFGILFGLGMIWVVAGGFAAAWLAKAQELLHAALVGLASLAIGAACTFVLDDPTPYPDWYQPLSYGLTAPAAIAGGLLAQRLRRRVRVPAT